MKAETGNEIVCISPSTGTRKRRADAKCRYVPRPTVADAMAAGYLPEHIAEYLSVVTNA
jgi:hypothetical protein